LEKNGGGRVRGGKKLSRKRKGRGKKKKLRRIIYIFNAANDAGTKTSFGNEGKGTL